MEIINFGNYRIEKLSDDKIKDVQYLFNKAFNSVVSEANIRNKHINCHGTNKFIGFLAYDKDTSEPAAYYAVYPGFLKFKKELILVAQSGDTMTNPKFQKQGLFVKLAEITFDYCKLKGIEMITGLPNTNSYHGFIKYLSFQELPKFSNLSFIENKFELNRISSRIRFTKKLHETFVKFIIKNIFKKSSSFDNSNQNGQDIAFMIHDKEYFNLKNSENDIFISIKGISIWLRIINNSIIIADMDLGHNDENKLKKVIFKLRLITVLTGLRFLSFSATENSYLYSKLKRFSKCESKGYTFILRNLTSNLPLNKISLLSCDADVF